MTACGQQVEISANETTSGNRTLHGLTVRHLSDVSEWKQEAVLTSAHG